MRFLPGLVFGILLFCQSAFSQDSWQDIQSKGKGTITAYWFPNNPFGYKDASGRLTGIEVEIIESFQKYLKDRHNIDLTVHWVKDETFIDVLTHLKNSTTPGVFGAAGFSSSEERRTFMKFSPSYMADVAVLVSTEDIPIVKSKDDLKKYFSGSTALTAQGTILEKELIKLRDENEIQFTIKYTDASEELIKELRTHKKSFGYLSLPVYLMNLDNGSTKLNRQNFLTKRYEGRVIGLPKNSDWDIPLNEYFASEEFNRNIELIISNYVNLDMYHFIDSFNPENEVSLLNQEKKMQQMQLEVQHLQLQDKNRERFYLVLIVSAVSILLVAILVLFRKLSRNHKLLQEQKTEIETQSEEIRAINDNLELTIRQRTQDLENKNKALEEYAFITAHKLRAPLASILGLIALIDKIELSKEDRIMVKHLNQSAKKLDDVIHTVMDAIDGTDSTKIKKMSPQFIVANIDNSIEFYTKKLGFELEFRYEDFYAGVLKDGYSIHLKTGNTSVEERKIKRENDDLDIIFSVDGVEDLYQEFVSKSIEVTQPLCERPYGREFYVADPDGYILAFLEEK